MFYTYYHTRNDSQKPFYVGKGSGGRAYDSDRNRHWLNIVKKHSHTVHIAAEWPTENEAFEHERFLILCFKDMGIELCNKTSGGEGTVGWVPTAENRAVTSAVTKARWTDPEYKKRVVEAMRTAMAKEGASDRRIAALKKSIAKPEVKAKYSAAQKKLWSSPEHRAKLLKSRQQSSAVANAKELRLEKSAASMRTPEARERASRLAKARWATPEFREMMKLKRSGK